MAVTVRKEIGLPNLLVSPYFTAADTVEGPLSFTYTPGQPNSIPGGAGRTGTKFVIVKLINASVGTVLFGVRPYGSSTAVYNQVPSQSNVYACVRLNENGGVPCISVRCASKADCRLYLIGWSDLDTFSTDSTNYTPIPTSWVTNDLTADTNYIGAWFHMQSRGYTGGTRKNGSSDTHQFSLPNLQYVGGGCGLDANGNAQLYGASSTANAVAYRCYGFFHTDDWAFNTNWPEIGADPGATYLNDWRTIETGVTGAKALIVMIRGYSGLRGAVRAAGASDNHQDYSYVPLNGKSWAIVACDELGRIEGWREHIDIEFWLVGWVKGPVEKAFFDYSCLQDEFTRDADTGEQEDFTTSTDEFEVVVVTVLTLEDKLKLIESNMNVITYTTGLSDKLICSDSIVTIFSSSHGIIDKLVCSDSIATVFNSSHGVTDKLKLIEIPTSIVTYLTSITDKLNLLESSNLQLVIPLSVNDFLRLSDSSIIALTLHLSTIDKLKLYESRATIHNMLITTSDSLRLYEHVTSNRTVVMTISDLVNLSENAILTLLTTIIELFLTDLLKLTDTPVTARIVTEYLTDYLHMIESSHNIMTSTISIGDFLKLTEPRLAWEGATYLLALTDMLKLVESHTNRADYFQHLIDKIKISEALSTIHNMHINLTDIIVLKEHALTPTGEPLIIFKLRAGTYTYALTTKGRIFRLPNMNRTFTV